jgi:hypothetical protein
MLRPAKLIHVLQLSHRQSRLLSCSTWLWVSKSKHESSVVSESRTDKLIAPEGLKVGNIEDVKNTYRAGGTKQKTVRIGRSPEYSEINC